MAQEARDRELETTQSQGIERRRTERTGDQILAIPTLVRQLPHPVRKIIGDLSNAERVLIGLDIRKQG